MPRPRDPARMCRGNASQVLILRFGSCRFLVRVNTGTTASSASPSNANLIARRRYSVGVVEHSGPKYQLAVTTAQSPACTVLPAEPRSPGVFAFAGACRGTTTFWRPAFPGQASPSRTWLHSLPWQQRAARKRSSACRSHQVNATSRPTPGRVHSPSLVRVSHSLASYKDGPMIDDLNPSWSFGQSSRSTLWCQTCGRFQACSPARRNTLRTRRLAEVL